MAAELRPARSDRGAGWGRRTFLASALGAAGAVVLAGGPAGALERVTSSGPAPAAPATGLRRGDWAVGSTVALAGPGGRVRATVAEVADGAGAAGHPGRFSILLRAPAGVRLDGLHTVTRAGAWRAALYLSPVERGVRGQLHQIVVNNPA